MHGLVLFDDLGGDQSDRLLLLSRPRSETVEGLPQIGVVPGGDDSFGLLDDDPAVERTLELVDQGESLVQSMGLIDHGGGDIGDSLQDVQLGRVEGR